MFYFTLYGIPLSSATYSANIARFLHLHAFLRPVKQAKYLPLAYREMVSRPEKEADRGGNQHKESVPRLRAGRGVRHPPPHHPLAGCQGGGLKASGYGRAVRFHVKDLDEFMASRNRR